MKKWMKISLWVIGISVVLFVGFGYAFYKRFVVNPPDYSFDEPKNIKEEQQQDLAYLALYPDYDQSFDTDTKKTKFQKQLECVEKQLPLSKTAFELEVAKALAIADNGHTNISISAFARKINAVPLRLYWFKEGLFVILAQEEFANLLGQRVVKINGYSPDSLIMKMSTYFGGKDEFLKARSPLLLMSPEALYAMELGEHKDTLELEFAEAQNRISTHKISFSQLEKDIPGYWLNYWLHPSSKIKNSSWKTLVDSDKTALPFQQINRNVHHDYFGSTLYVQINEIYNEKDRSLKKYLKKVSSEAKRKEVTNYVLDLRFNQGGSNYSRPWKFINFVKESLESNQKCWIIIGNSTFSAGIITVAYAKYIIGDKAIIIGEEVGDRLTFWADGGTTMTLPNSGISPRIWTAYNDWKNGCKDFKKCFWFALFNSVPAKNIDPEIEVALSFYDYIDGKDSILAYILNEGL